jgi:hypothetical protein
VASSPKTLIAVAIDQRQKLTLRVEVENVGQFGVIEAELSGTDLDKIASAQSALVVTSPALQKKFVFKADQTAKAVRFLRASCQDEVPD